MLQNKNPWEMTPEELRAATGGAQPSPSRRASIAPIEGPPQAPPPQRPAEAAKAQVELERARLALDKDRADAAASGNVSPPGNAALTGKEYLAALPAPLAAQVKALSEGRLPIPTGAALRSPQVMQLWAAAAQYDPQLDYANAKTRAATRKEFTSGGAARNITSMNTAIAHLERLDNTVDELDNWSGVPLANHLLNQARNAVITGSGSGESLKAFQAERQAAADELTRAFRMSGGNVHDIEGWERTLDEANSPEELHAAIHSAVGLLGSRIQTMGDQYNQGMQRTADPLNLLNPHAAEVMRRMDPTWLANPAQVSGSDAPPGAPPVDPLTGSPTQRMAPDEEVHFNDQAAAPRGQRLPPEQETQVLDAVRAGDVGQAVALLQKFTGAPADRQGVAAATQRYLKHPERGVILGYGQGDQAAQDAFDQERYGNHLRPAIEGAGKSALRSGARGVLSGATLGAAPYIGAAGNTLVSAIPEMIKGNSFGQIFADKLKNARALDEADYRVNPITRGVGEMVGGALSFPAAEASLARASARIPGVLGTVARSPVTADALASGTNSYLGSQDDGVANGLGGAAFGAGAGVLGRTLGRGIAPTGGALRPLYDAKVLPTPGQRLGGFADVVEKGLETVPVLGGLVRGARQQARNEFERGAFDDSLKEIGAALPEEVAVGTKAHAFAQQKFAEAYTNARAGMSAKLDDEFHKGFDDLAEHISTGGIPEDSAKRFKTIIGNAVASRLNGDSLSGEAYQAAASRIDKQIATLRNQPNSDQELAGALEEFSGLLDQAARRSSPPETVKALDDADRGYAKFVRIESASKSAENPGRFTPKQYANAVMKESGGRAARSKAFLRGEALGQDYASAGLRLGEPPSEGSTAALKKGATTGLLAAGGYVSPIIPVSAALATLPYAPVLRAATNRILAPRDGDFATLLAKIGSRTVTGTGAAYAVQSTKGQKYKGVLVPIPGKESR